MVQLGVCKQANSMSYERTIIHGVPFYEREGVLYAWDDEHISAGTIPSSGRDTNGGASSAFTPLRLGVGNSKGETLTLDADWESRAKPLLDTWRASQEHRSRALLRTVTAAAPTKRKRRTTTAAATAEPEPEPTADE